MSNPFQSSFFPQVLKQNILKDGFEFPMNEKFYSSNSKYYLVFESLGLVLYSLEPPSVVWRGNAIRSARSILHDNGNLVIYDDSDNAIWSSLSNPLGICEGRCSSASSCSLGLECYQAEQDTFQVRVRHLSEGTNIQSEFPSNEPSGLPSNTPSLSNEPSSLPSNEPSALPSLSNGPSTSNEPSALPSGAPSISSKPSLSMFPTAFVSECSLSLHSHLHCCQ